MDIEPLAAVEVKLPGVIATLLAPVVDQLSEVLEPELMLAGLAVKELIAGMLWAATVTVAFDVTEPVEFVAVSVYVVVAVGLTLVDPLAEADVNDPGEIETLVAPDVDQLKVLLPPALMLEGEAVNELIVGAAGAAGVPTVTVTVADADPTELVAVRVKVIVAGIGSRTMESTCPSPL